MVGNRKSSDPTDSPKEVTLPCGCGYQDKGWMLTRSSECEYHKRKKNYKATLQA